VGDAPSSGGRPASILAFNHAAGVVLVGDLGQTGCHLAVCDLGCGILAERALALSIIDGPETVLGYVREQFDELLAEVGRDRSEVFGIGIGLPGPVDYASGRPVQPPAMPGWDGADVPAFFDGYVDAPILVDNDARIMALGEHRTARRDDAHLLFVKVGSGIGAGVVIDGRLHRGERGGAGDIGHIFVPSGGDEVCSCGNTGCLDAVAGGWSIARRMGDVAPTPPDVVRLAKEGHPEAVREVRRSGRLIGEAVAAAVNLLSPTSVVLGGKLAEVDTQVFAAVREVVYGLSTPAATRHLEIALSELGPKAGVVGAAHLVVDHVFAPEHVGRLLPA
jgi:predicted NBD/HSP70 family sugar kinase